MTPSLNPLQLPEIRARLSRFVLFKDVFACVLVNKSWSKDFTHVFWHTVDLTTHKGFQDLDRQLIAKNGQYIRVVKNISTVQELASLDHPSVSSLCSLMVVTRQDPRCQAYVADILRRNIMSLESLTIHASSTNNQASSSSQPPVYVSLDSFASLSAVQATTDISSGTRSINSNIRSSTATSNLKSLDVRGLAISRGTFTSLLKACPDLHLLAISETVIFSDRCDETEFFKHPQYFTLIAPMKQVFEPDPQKPDAPPLLAHFPKTICWRVGESLPQQESSR
ncbi:hypothetical protein BGZ65_010865, partial [Modicella reniformis]